MELSIVTLSDNEPSVMRNPLAGCWRLDEWREAATNISKKNGDRAVVWLMEEDGEYPIYRYEAGVEHDMRHMRRERIKKRVERAIEVLEELHGTVNMEDHIHLLHDIRDVLEG
jgi:hypothetical protein